jgi:hypothetical protein
MEPLDKADKRSAKKRTKVDVKVRSLRVKTGVRAGVQPTASIDGQHTANVAQSSDWHGN